MDDIIENLQQTLAKSVWKEQKVICQDSNNVQSSKR